ncbi:unnamed protein product, partial [Oppiella nova]
MGKHEALTPKAIGKKIKSKGLQKNSRSLLSELEMSEQAMPSIAALTPTRDDKPMPSGYCAPYSGTVCRRYIPNNSLVYFNLTTDDFGVHIPLNEMIAQNLWTELISSLQEPCRSAAETLFCNYAFPQCHYTQGSPVSKTLCREDCIAVRESLCNREWALLEDNKQKGIFFKSRGHFRLPDCDLLPSHANLTDPPCSHASLTVLQTDQVTYSCAKGRGRYYQGRVNVTKEGIPCQKWDSQVPHTHNRPPFVFPEIWNSDNYCRNAGGEEPHPWCYTSDPLVRWQHCHIPSCGNYLSIKSEAIHVKSETIQSEEMAHNNNETVDPTLIEIFSTPLQSNFNPPLILILSSIVVLIFGCLLVIILTVCRLNKHRRRGYNAALTTDVEIDLNKLPSNFAYHSTSVKLNPKLEALEYPRNDIIYIRDIGAGAFGRVFMAKAPNLVKGEELTLIAVKMLKEEATEDLVSDFEREASLMSDFDHQNILKLLGVYLVSDFEREASLMSDFDHQNILKLLGVCAVGKPMCLLIEYMGRGDLNEFLRSCSPSNYIIRAPNSDSYNDIRLNHMDLVNIARQIAAGMIYLSDRKFVHRDLATRNCLVSNQMVVKIADFGLSQKIYTSNYYKGSEHDAVPIRWMPLESILYNKFTIETDCWAYGVLLWEIFSFALQPYYGMTHEEVVKYVKEGNVLVCPDSCPPAIYQLMKMCWNKKPNNRP